MAKIKHSIKDQLSFPLEEAYRALRSNIQFRSGQDKKIKTITITSCTPKEGKTTTSINLAISMAKANIKVILIDADLRNTKSVTNLISINKLGLSNLLSGNYVVEDVINETNIPNFYFIASGPKPMNPAELISSSKFSELLVKVAEQFDIVIIDTPPLGNIIDGAVIAAQTDGTIMVIESKSVAAKTAQRGKDQLEKANARILGVVLNKIKKNDYKNYFKHYDYFKKNHDTQRLEKLATEEVGRIAYEGKASY